MFIRILTRYFQPKLVYNIKSSCKSENIWECLMIILQKLLVIGKYLYTDIKEKATSFDLLLQVILLLYAKFIRLNYPWDAYPQFQNLIMRPYNTPPVVVVYEFCVVVLLLYELIPIWPCNKHRSLSFCINYSILCKLSELILNLSEI